MLQSSTLARESLAHLNGVLDLTIQLVDVVNDNDNNLMSLFDHQQKEIDQLSDSVASFIRHASTRMTLMEHKVDTHCVMLFDLIFVVNCCVRARVC